MTETSQRIGAGLVTYNPEMDRLQANLSSLLPQVDEVFVFDNGSANVSEVRQLLQDLPSCHLIEAGENLGMSRALNQILRSAESQRYDRVLLLDQDSVAPDDLVLRLVEAFEAAERDLEAPIGMVGSTINDRNMPQLRQKDYGRALYEPRASVITSGTLVSVPAWRTVGGYDERLFLDWVDHEFSGALRTHGYAVVSAPRAVLLHEMGHREVFLTLPAWLKRKVPYSAVLEDGRQVLCRENYPSFRWEDRMRSMTIVCEKFRGTEVGDQETRLRASQVKRALALERSRPTVLRALLRGYREGEKAARLPQKPSSLV